MVFKTTKKHSQKKLETDTYVLILSTFLIFLFWMCSLNGYRGNNQLYLLIPFLLGAFLSLIKSIYIFKGNIFITSKKMIVVDATSGFLVSSYKKMESVDILNSSDAHEPYFKLYGNIKNSEKFVKIIKDNGKEYVVCCQTPQELYDAIKSKLH